MCGIRAGSSRTPSQSQRRREGRKKDKGKEKKGEQMEEKADMVHSLLEDAPTPPRKFCLIKKEKIKKKPSSTYYW